MNKTAESKALHLAALLRNEEDFFNLKIIALAVAARLENGAVPAFIDNNNNNRNNNNHNMAKYYDEIFHSLLIKIYKYEDIGNITTGELFL
jgi:hypothetical protein